MALGDGIGRSKDVSHWSYRRQHDYCDGAKAFMDWLLLNEKYSACLIDTDEKGIFNDVGLMEDNYFVSGKELFEEFKKDMNIR